jgi:hypothetical protein
MEVNSNRRRVLKQGLALAASALAGCGGGSAEEVAPDSGTPRATGSSPSSAPTAAWMPFVPVLIVGSGATFDLKSTLPAEVQRGGVFGIDAQGSRLPTGMNLTTAGILSVGSAALSSVAGVIFTYDAP